MQSLLALFRTSTHIVNISLADLTDEIACARTRGHDGPSITWTLGHLLESRLKVLAMLGDVRPNPWSAQFGDTAATDGTDYPLLAALLAEWTQLHGALEAAFANAGGLLDVPVAGAGLHGETSLRDRIAFLAWHEGYHIGVIGAARKAVGLPGPAELAQAQSRAA